MLDIEMLVNKNQMFSMQRVVKKNIDCMVGLAGGNRMFSRCNIRYIKVDKNKI